MLIVVFNSQRDDNSFNVGQAKGIETGTRMEWNGSEVSCKVTHLKPPFY